MKILILSDVHGNLEALEAVLSAASDVDRSWCLGDLVGYGPDPEACVARIRGRCSLVLAGNHDLGVTGRLNLGDFNPVAAEALLWTRSRLSPEALAYLKGLPSQVEVPELGVLLVHGSPRDPVWEYIFSPGQILEVLRETPVPLTFVGHTHNAFWAAYDPESGELEVEGRPAGQTLRLEGGRRYLINPGSVGQPRDGDPRAAFALWDTETGEIRFERVEYDLRAVQMKILRAGLPPQLAERLSYGF